MYPVASDRLRGTKTFVQLTAYLREELDWPLNEYVFDELTFEYQPSELGLKDLDAAQATIHQLRPLVAGQPWGIFFIEFDKKRLPVVVFRRILSHLVVKKRASSNRAERAAWHVGDLLFISAFGNVATDDREIAFAHFHQESGDLPTLRVLGWDGGNTSLTLSSIEETLKARLCWPKDTTDAEAWRKQWSGAFRHRIGHIIRTANKLAEVLAILAGGIRDRAKTMLAAENERGPLTKLFRAFQTALLHDLTRDSFADTYAQSITYGLLTAAFSHPEMADNKNAAALVADSVIDNVPVTNPFLKEMLQTFLKVGGRKEGIDFDELGIQDVVELLRSDETDLPAIIEDFGNKNPDKDPVIYFYEHFLSAYNNQLKIQRGVFYTPKPVVSYIVRSVHELLQTEFGIKDGLASIITWGEMAAKHAGLKIPNGVNPNEPFVVILDPATGTATFLVEAIVVIHSTLTAKWKQQRLTESQQLAAWNEYVPKHLLPRLYGYELMMAPYAIAHMKFQLKLKETGFTAWNQLGDQDRARIYLTNSLEPTSDDNQQREFEALAPALAHEARAVNAVKRHQPFTVVIGNPPWAGISPNMSEQARHIVDAYKLVDGHALNERKLWLQDDYVKFIRTAQTTLEQTGIGILGYLTNHGYLTNPTFRGMRQSLMNTFQRIQMVDLHGNMTKRERSPDGRDDKNVFDIRQGVAICLATRGGDGRSRTARRLVGITRSEILMAYPAQRR
jgi:predicted helicase